MTSPARRVTSVGSICETEEAGTATHPQRLGLGLDGLNAGFACLTPVAV